MRRSIGNCRNRPRLEAAAAQTWPSPRIEVLGSRSASKAARKGCRQSAEMARKTATANTPWRQPAATAMGGTAAAISMAPAGTPHCFRLKISPLRRAGVRAASKWLPAGVTGPWPSPAMMAEAKSAAGCPSAAKEMPKAEISIPTCRTRMPPKRWMKAPAKGPDTMAPR